jgi:hypothetical protein
MQVISPKSLGPEFQELKEAVCDALVNLTTDYVSGAGSNGDVIYGTLPRGAFVAGMLLPRFDDAGSDETSDIHISTLGIDLHVLSDAALQAELRPSFSTYVRVLPTWEELQNQNLALEFNFRLRPEVEQNVRDTIRTERRQLFAAENLNRADPKDMPAAERLRRKLRRAAIRSEVTRQAYAAHGIEIALEEAAKAVAASNGTNPTASPQDTDQQERIEHNAHEVVDGADLVSLSRLGRRVPPHLLLPAEIPLKWRRITPPLPAFSWNLRLAGEELAQEVGRYSARMRVVAIDCIRNWILSAEGLEQVWRHVPVMPGDVLNQTTWEAFLARVRAMPPQIDSMMPDLNQIRVQADKLVNFADPAISSLRVTLENDNCEIGGRGSRHRTEVIFQTRVELRIPSSVHRHLVLDRVESSYRFRDHMRYPAMGLNCGVTSSLEEDTRVLATTWAPRFIQPRIVAQSLNIPLEFAKLADPELDISELDVLPAEYRRWISQHESHLRVDVRRGLSQEDAEAESRRLESDLEAQRKEARFIERGIQLLAASQRAAKQLIDIKDHHQKERLAMLAAPWWAWILMNRSYLSRESNNAGKGWRLFQIAFILAHVPTLASRMVEYKDWHTPELDETSASLLYFPTGGGKSEAFYGTLIFGMFLDRLRGKNRGVTGMIRYPLRLLTLQQAQRFMRLMVHAELIRKAEGVGCWPFEVGFWVGKTNTPNRFSQVSAHIPFDDDTDHPDDTLLIPERLPGGVDDAVREKAQAYEEGLLAYNKIPKCPVCGALTGLRRIRSNGDTAKRLAILCFSPTCEWNRSHNREPLPFLLTDDTIYQRAPAVILGTIDKMAMLGQNTETICQLLGMFGLARWIGPTGHLYSPRGENDLEGGAVAKGYETVYPAYRSGRRIFHDPFPSLIIQDEAHLLEESLGTFSGLFDSLFELIFTRIVQIGGEELQVARSWMGSYWGGHRSPKVIAATATVSDPDKQLEVLYQRTPLRFPYPGPDIYHSFFAVPAPVPENNVARKRLEQSLPPALAPEATAPWMRLYVSLMTNGATHTMTTVSVLSGFHLIITELWRGLSNPATRVDTIARLRRSISCDTAGDWHRDALDRAVIQGQENAVLALIDLHRIALTYVTNKKGGDQIMDALDQQVKRDHRSANSPIDAFDIRLISGGIDMRTIQQIMSEAEAELASGTEYPPIDRQMRSVVATSAISHGVDVDRFNSMFFAGLPSDVAEYIQASSRVGRTHVGFVMLVPTPQSRRDRYVVETHDIFHRFLERMIAPPAVQRWASNAIRRVTASVIQSWATLREAEAFANRSDDQKYLTPNYDVMRQLHTFAVSDSVSMRNDLGSYMLQAIGFPGRGPGAVGRPVYEEVYRDLADRSMKEFVDNVSTFNSQIRLAEFWAQNSGLQPPMTSLRDVDEAGLIVPSTFDPRASGGNRRVSKDAFVEVMKAIRTQKGTAAETDREGDEALPGGTS